MKRYEFKMWVGLALGVGGLLLTGCRNTKEIGVTSRYNAAAGAGRVVGGGVGTVAGGAAGAVVGVGEGLAYGMYQPFNNRTYVVRRWRTETTPDGRTVHIPEDILVDEYGRPVKAVKAE